MHLQASFLQLLALGILVASTVALGQKIFELYGEQMEQEKAEKRLKPKLKPKKIKLNSHLGA